MGAGTDGTLTIATHACLAATVKRSPLLGDFLDLVGREQYRIFGTTLTANCLDDYLDDCRGRDPEMPVWNESTRIRPSIFRVLAQAGYIESNKDDKTANLYLPPRCSLTWKSMKQYVLRCIQVGP